MLATVCMYTCMYLDTVSHFPYYPDYLDQQLSFLKMCSGQRVHNGRIQPLYTIKEGLKMAEIKIFLERISPLRKVQLLPSKNIWLKSKEYKRKTLEKMADFTIILRTKKP